MGDKKTLAVSKQRMKIFLFLLLFLLGLTTNIFLCKQVLISKWMRSLLVNWMVEVQEFFELNHETLYLGVKITDIYLSKVVVGKSILQLVGATALFIASKYDVRFSVPFSILSKNPFLFDFIFWFQERMPPLIDDFRYISENAFEREDMIKMEMDVFRVIGFNLGIPLSYRLICYFVLLGNYVFTQVQIGGKTPV